MRGCQSWDILESWDDNYTIIKWAAAKEMEHRVAEFVMALERVGESEKLGESWMPKYSMLRSWLIYKEEKHS